MESYAELLERTNKELKSEGKRLEKMYIPDDEKTQQALGPLGRAIPSERIRCVFTLDIMKKYYKKMTIKSPSDWIPSVQEESQNFDAYKVSGFNELYQDRNTIYIQPLDLTMDEKFLENGKTFGEAFYFGLPVVIRKPKDIKKLKITKRDREDGKYVQYNAREILRSATHWIPDDAYGMIGITNYDIYHREDWNFVFGLGALKDRTGVFSFARYNPSFFDDSHNYTEEEVRDLVQYRSIRVMNHEIGHMFGLKHGVYFECTMNGSMSAEESSGRPSSLCLIGLRKLWHNIGFDPLERFKALSEVGNISDLFQKDKEYYNTFIAHLEEIYKEKKLDKPFKKRYSPKDPNKPVKKTGVAFGSSKKQTSKKTGIRALIDKKKNKS